MGLAYLLFYLSLANYNCIINAVVRICVQLYTWKQTIKGDNWWCIVTWGCQCQRHHEY